IMPVKAKPKIHEFTLVMARAEELTPELADALYQIFDDGTAGSCNGEVFIDFHRQAPTFSDAVQSALKDVSKAAHQVARVRTEQSQLVERPMRGGHKSGRVGADAGGDRGKVRGRGEAIV